MFRVSLLLTCRVYKPEAAIRYHARVNDYREEESIPLEHPGDIPGDIAPSPWISPGMSLRDVPGDIPGKFHGDIPRDIPWGEDIRRAYPRIDQDIVGIPGYPRARGFGVL